MSKRKTVRVSTRAKIYAGIRGYRVRWVDAGGTVRAYFVANSHDAKLVRRRAKAGKIPTFKQVWAVKV